MIEAKTPGSEGALRCPSVAPALSKSRHLRAVLHALVFDRLKKSESSLGAGVSTTGALAAAVLAPSGFGPSRARLSLVGEVEASDAIGWRTMGGLGAHNGEAGHVTTWINEDVPAMRRRPTNGAKLDKFALALVSFTKHAIF